MTLASCLISHLLLPRRAPSPPAPRLPPSTIVTNLDSPPPTRTLELPSAEEGEELVGEELKLPPGLKVALTPHTSPLTSQCFR